MIRVSRGRCLLLDLITAKGLTQAEFSRRSGIHPRVVSDICRGKLIMRPEQQYAAALILGCNIEDLHDWIITHVKE